MSPDWELVYPQGLGDRNLDRVERAPRELLDQEVYTYDDRHHIQGVGRIEDVVGYPH